MNANTPTYAHLGARVAQARKFIGLQQSELASVMNTTQQTISRWEAGVARPRPLQLSKLATAIGVDENELRRLARYPEKTGPTPIIHSLDQLFPVDGLLPVPFERFMYYLLHRLYPTAREVRPAGKAGHKQGGLDVEVVFANGTVYSFQCKRVAQFGPADVTKAVAAHTAWADKKFLVLSRIASPPTATEIRKHSDWDLWDREDLSRLIRMELEKVDQIRLVDIFFPGQRMTLLGEPEAGPWQTSEEFFAPFRGTLATFSHGWPIVGGDRKSLATTIAEKLIEEPGCIVFLAGMGGLGKSRLLKEIAEQVSATAKYLGPLFLSPTDQLNSKALDDLGRSPRIVIVDDAHDRTDLQGLFAYGASRDIRVLVALRPYAVQRLRGQIAAAARSGAVDQFDLQRLSDKEVEELAAKVLAEHGGDPGLAQMVASATRDCPLVTVLAAKIAATDKLPVGLVQNAQAFRDTIMAKFAKGIPDEIAQGTDRKIVENLLKVVALVQPFGTDDPVFLNLAAEVTGHPTEEISAALKRLVSGGILFKRGSLYRLMPDLLGDYIIEQTCIDISDRLNSFADKVFNVASGELLGHTLVNLGRLDWRRSSGDSSKSSLMAHLWRALRVAGGFRDHALEAASAAAFYQPRQAIDFVDEAARAGARHDEFSTILKNAAYNFAHVEEVSALLWELGRDDGRDWSRHPGHPLRVLKELCAVEPNKPIDFSRVVVEFGLALLDDPTSFSSVSTPFSFLAGIIEGEGHTTEGNSREITFKPFFVRYDAVKVLRRQAIDAAVSLLQNGTVRAAISAARFLENSLRYPMGSFGSSLPDEARGQYTTEFIETLRHLRSLAESAAIAPIVMISVAKAVRWHAHYADDSTSIDARALIATLPETLEFRTTAALADGFGSIATGRFEQDWQSRQTAWIASIASDLNAAYPNAADLRRFLEECIDQVGEAGLSKPTSRSFLLEEMLLQRPDLALDFCNFCLQSPDSRLFPYFGRALYFVTRNDADVGRRLSRRLLDTGEIRFQQVAGWALHSLQLSEGRLAAEDRELMVRVLGARDASVVRSGLSAFGNLIRENPTIAIGLLRHMDLTIDSQLADDVLMYFHSNEDAFFSALQPDDVRYLLSQLKPLPALEGHWVETLLARLSRNFAELTFNFFRERVEGASEDSESFTRYRPINYGPWVHVPLQFKDSPSYAKLMEDAWSWITTRDTADWRFEHNATALFEAMFLPVDPAVIAFMVAKLSAAGEQALNWMSAILAHTAPDFAFENQAFVTNFLNACDRSGQPVRRAGINALFRASISGIRSGIPGKPFPEDLDALARCEALLKRLPRLSPTYELFDLVRRHAVDKVEFQRREGEAFEDN